MVLNKVRGGTGEAVLKSSWKTGKLHENSGSFSAFWTEVGNPRNNSMEVKERKAHLMRKGNLFTGKYAHT